MIKKCVGCGSVLQDKNHDAFGFTPDIKNKYCERCFKLKNYNEKKVVNLKYTNDEIIALLNKKATSVFFVTDFINISKYVIDVFNSIKVNKFLVINKVDYISKDIKKEKYINYIKETYSISSPILLVSALKKYNLNELNNKIALSKNSYIAGFTNSGKSSLVNSLLLLNNKKSLILESLMPNTTLDVIKVKLNEETYFYDTPGFITDYEFDEAQFTKKVMKPVTIQIKENDYLSIGNKIFISCDSVKNSFTFYMSSDIKIDKLYKDNEKINLDNKLNIPDDSDIVIPGYGFINVKKSCNIKINVNNVEIRTSMF